MRKMIALLVALMLIASMSATAEIMPLRVEGTALVQENGDPAVLRGLSTHGIGWFGQYVSEESFRDLKAGLGIDLIRLAMYTGENNGYCTDGDPEALKALVCKGVEAAVANDLYVIVDWHILSDNDPRAHMEEAKTFFDEISAKYANCPNVIYEICNEPNSGTTWENVREYANEVIPVIRANAPDAVVIVGTPDWCQRVDLAAADPITEYDNIMYALHFYADTHRGSLREGMADAIAAGLPVFVSEFGICSADGNGRNAIDQANAWMDSLNELGVPAVMWNLSNKDELSAILKPDCAKTEGYESTDLTESGLWLAHTLGGAWDTSFEGMDDRPEVAADANEMLSDTTAWGAWIDRAAGGDATVGYADGKVTAEVRKSGRDRWSVQPSHPGLKLEQGETYELVFTAESTAPITTEIHVQKNYDPYTAYASLEDQTFDAEAKAFTLKFTMTEATDGNVSLVFNIGANEGAPYTVVLSDISLRKVS